MSEKVKTLPKFKVGDQVNLLQEMVYNNGVPVGNDEPFPQIVDRVVIRERIDLKDRWGYRIERHPGIHEERYLEPCPEGSTRTITASVCKMLDLKDLLRETYLFAMGEIVQIGDVDEDDDDDEPMAYRFGIITGIGYDGDVGKTYYVGIWDGESSFLDTQYEFDEADLMKASDADKQTMLQATVPRPKLKLASNNQSPTPA